MIKAVFRFVKGTQTITKVSLSGHAEMGEYGYDIVCAGVSALMIASINGLDEYVQTKTNVKIENGETSFEINETDGYKSIQAQAIANTLYLAMLGMQDEYEDYIEVIITEEEKDD
ncbi:MAG: ribosomal-processing cysteine protease Prp [Eubacteriaceae bacterium]|nr:ribosomal-processing cysteine protease Prp [Eubacteriaceae bacterium]